MDAFLEPECAVSYIDPDGYVMVLSTDQSSHTTLHECMLLLGSDKVRVQNQLVGGGFGGKEDMSVQHHAALITYLTGRTVKVKLTRPESLLIHPKRHPFWMDFTMGCDENGIIQGVKAKVYSDTGAFASLGGPVLERACTHAAGPYNYQNFEIEGTAYYTNNPPAGAFRGFGVTQTCFATETLLNEMADKVGITPWEIRYRNAIRPGQEVPNGQIASPGTDRRRGDGPCRDAGGGQAVLRRGHEAGQACRHRLRDEKRGRRRRHPRLGSLQADRGRRREGPYLRGRFVHRPGRRHGARADDRHEYAADARRYRL